MVYYFPRICDYLSLFNYNAGRLQPVDGRFTKIVNAGESITLNVTEDFYYYDDFLYTNWVKFRPNDDIGEFLGRSQNGQLISYMITSASETDEGNYVAVPHYSLIFHADENNVINVIVPGNYSS